MNNNFDLKKFLTENKITGESKKVFTEEVRSNSAWQKIAQFITINHPDADDWGEEEFNHAVDLQFEEWINVQEMYSTMEEYFEDVLRENDFAYDSNLGE